MERTTHDPPARGDGRLMGGRNVANPSSREQHAALLLEIDGVTLLETDSLDDAIGKARRDGCERAGPIASWILAEPLAGRWAERNLASALAHDVEERLGA